LVKWSHSCRAALAEYISTKAVILTGIVECAILLNVIRDKDPTNGDVRHDSFEFLSHGSIGMVAVMKENIN